MSRPALVCFALLAASRLAFAEAGPVADPADDPADAVADPDTTSDPSTPEPRVLHVPEPEVESEGEPEDERRLPPRARRKLLPGLDPRVAPEPVVDPETVDSSSRDPADGSLEPLAPEPVEHGDVTGAPPFSTAVECPVGTSERRAVRDGNAELWCADARERRHGPFVRLHPSGSLKLRGNYLNGRRHGLFLAWFPSGRLEGRSAFERGLEQGSEELFYESGRRRSTTTFRAGKKHGQYRAWHENGTLAVSGQYVDDEPGPGFTFYDESGRAAPPGTTSAAAAANEDDEGEGRGPSISQKLGAAAGGAAGATVGIVVAVPLSLAIVSLRVLSVVDPQGLLVFLLVPPLLAATGAAIGTVLLTRFPGPVMAGLGAVIGLPVGIVVGGLVGGALASTAALGVLAAGGPSEATLGFLLLGLGVGAATGAGLAPGILAATAGWLYAGAPNHLE